MRNETVADRHQHPF